MRDVKLLTYKRQQPMSAEVKEKLIVYRPALAERERASGASKKTDLAIYRAVFGEAYRFSGLDDDGPGYTSSLDTTIALVERVLPGWAREVSFWDGLARASLWECDREGWHGSKSIKETATSKTEPLALLTALFRALIAQMEKAE